MESVAEVIGKAKGTRARKDASKQEGVTQPQVIAKKIDELVKLYKEAHASGEVFSDAVKAAAEASGYNAKAVRSLVVARAGESFLDKKRDVDQQYELFEEVGE
jgi:hypothetical protein